MKDMKPLLAGIKLLACDFDGVFTDGTVFQDQDGKEMVKCSRKDGLGINLLQQHGIEVAVVSKETNPVVSRRCQKMKIPCYQAVDTGEGKAEILKRLAEEKGLSLEQVAFMGDDLNDVPALKIAGLAITVADGHFNVKKIADYVTKAPGGQHAVREVAELILIAKGVNLDQF